MIQIVRRNLNFLFAKYASCHGIPCSVSVRPFSTSKDGEPIASPAVFDLLLHKYQFSPQVASKAASAGLKRAKGCEKSDSILSFLKESGFSNAQLQKMVNYSPQMLSARLEDKIKAKIRVFQDLGLSSNDIARIISSNPVILELNLNTRVIPSFYMLKDLLGTEDDVVKLLRKSGWFLIADLKRSLFPNIEFLKSCGIPMKRICILLKLYPRCLLLRPEIISKSVEKAKEIGINRSSDMFIHAIPILCTTCEDAWERKFQALQNCGFSESDIMKMFAKFPSVFYRSVHKLNRVKDTVLATGKYHMSCIVDNPTSVAYSIEKRYKPRFQILQILESKNLIKKWPALITVSTMPDEKFFKKFIGPYLSEVGKVYVAKSSAGAKKVNLKLCLEELELVAVNSL